MADGLANIAPSLDSKDVQRAYQLDLTNANYESVNYKYRKLPQISGGTNLTLLNGSVVESRFNIAGNSVWNLSRSFIVLDAVFTGVADYSAATFVDSIPLNQVQLLTENGSVLVDIQQAQIYSKIIQPLTLSKDEYLSRGSVYANVAVDTSVPSINMGCNPLKRIANIGTNGATASYRADIKVIPIQPTDASILQDGTFSAVVPVAASGTDCLYNNPQQHVAAGTIAAATANRYRINLKTFVGTLLAVDKSLFFGQNLTLVLRWAPLQNWGFDFKDAAYELKDAAALAATSVTNYFIYLAEDINKDNQRSLRQAFNSGYSMLIPYTTSTQQSSSSTGLATVQSTISSGNGYCLKRAISACVSSTNSLQYTANTFNVAGSKWTSVQSFLDANPIQDIQLSISMAEPWNYLYDFIKDSPVGMSQRTYLENAFWIDNFSDSNRSVDIPFMDQKDSGLYLYDESGNSIQRTYRVEFITVPAAVLMVQYLTYLRTMKISPQGVTLQ